ncbi:MAG: DUF4338 domain-containing protein [Rhodobacteraceae bacterium]|nr:DUF4338 domain-containing protein [Paracoccaceae bacterium]
MREKNQPLVVDQPRILILPWFHMPDPGSSIPAIIPGQLPKDWTARFNVSPVACETCVQVQSDTGAIFKA